MATASRAGQVLRLLLQAGGERSGQEMAERLGCTRSAVAKAVSALRDQGLKIEAAPRRGYRLHGEPPLVLPAMVEARLKDGSLGLPLYYFPEIDSTNLEARRRAENGAPHGACLVAEHQSAGRGRLDRRWQSPKGSALLFSLILRPELGLGRIFALNNLVSLALCRALERHGGLAPTIKWPNDLYLEGRKLAGVLTEFTSRAESVDHAVVGVGLNVNQEPAWLAGLDQPGISLRAATGHAWHRAELLAWVLDELSGLYGQFVDGESEDLAQEYAQRSLILGMEVTVREGQNMRQGRATGFAPSGALLLEEDGVVSPVHHGDVSLLAWEEIA
ncbi:MAG: biotin--[acetyl-CoA-carboxylase] ligase [Desulfarculaceae bacterium]|nr:biotin--[acetyl-CoA-carboxylase] ligase [Desulfarculaceae bacterium]MCF8072778.1 biotin--[acetyl-CoA-carboxylase] ligase [Desulfarculaceae bacterium]MCF8100946.1 biotin--[acetyl-CoA-carboxylase] ligase [Desulfarculaceae bacterium]MCF8117570.1 biotin--[acetyl-CoA-carboxylase] ligase [Desulfarculaceae bacterium]